MPDLTYLFVQGSWPRDLMASLPIEEQQTVKLDVAKFAVRLLNGLAVVQAERDSQNGTAREQAPPVMPAELVKFRTGKFISDILDVYRPRVCKFSSTDDVEAIEKDHKKLVMAYNSYKSALRTQSISILILQCSIMLGTIFKVSLIRAFSGGLATAFANTTSVESDFSILKWEKTITVTRWPTCRWKVYSRQSSMIF